LLDSLLQETLIMILRWIFLMLFALTRSASSDSKPELYRSIVMDHFLHKAGNYQIDRIFNDIDSFFHDDFKRDTNNDIITNEISDFSDVVLNTKPATTSSKILPFVHLGGSSPIAQFNAPVAFKNPGELTLPKIPAPITVNQQSQPRSEPKSQFAIKPFTFFISPSGLHGPQAQPQPQSPAIVEQSPPNVPRPGPVQPRQDHARALVLPDFIDNNDLQPSSLVSAPILPPLPVHKTTGIMRTPIQPSQLAFGSSGSIDMFSFPSRESHNNDIKPDLTMTMIGQNEGLHFSQPILRHPEPAKVQFVPQPSIANLGEPISNNILTENQDQDQPFNIFEYIGRPTAEREVRKKLNNMAGSGKKMGKMEALNMLMSIAGDHWEKDLLMGQKDDNSDGLSGTNFVCPMSDGHFPDSDKCDVYYTCAGGIPHKYTCQTGLMWNTLTNQCDWEQSVNCSINKKYLAARP